MQDKISLDKSFKPYTIYLIPALVELPHFLPFWVQHEKFNSEGGIF